MRRAPTVLILPSDNLAEARAAGDRGVELVPVDTFADALAAPRGDRVIAEAAYRTR